MAFFSIIIPVYHHPQRKIERLAMLERALHSILRQSFADYLVFVIDDGSKQGKHIRALCEQMDNRFRYARRRNRGVAASRNLGIELALSHHRNQIFFFFSSSLASVSRFR